VDEKPVDSSDNRYVAFFDILGMGDLILQNHQKGWDVLGRLRRAIEAGLEKVAFTVATEHMAPTTELEYKAAKYIRYFTFSDTVLMITHGKTPADLLSNVSFSSQLFAHAFQLCVPLRGAIVYGEFWFNFEHNLFSGPALVAAYRSADEPQWFGVTVDDTVSIRMTPFFNPSSLVSPICEWNLKVKNEMQPKRLKVLDWVTSINESLKISEPLDGRHLYDAGFQKIFGPFENLDEKSREKYAATADFINSRVARTASTS
jgi:hypothetical protein